MFRLQTHKSNSHFTFKESRKVVFGLHCNRNARGVASIIYILLIKSFNKIEYYGVVAKLALSPRRPLDLKARERSCNGEGAITYLRPLASGRRRDNAYLALTEHQRNIVLINLVWSSESLKLSKTDKIIQILILPNSS